MLHCVSRFDGKFNQMENYKWVVYDISGETAAELKKKEKKSDNIGLGFDR